MSRKVPNKFYLVEVAAGQIKEFDNWPACQAFVKGKPFPFAGGPTRAAAQAKLQATRDKQMAYRSSGKKGASPKKKAALGPRPTEGITSDAGTRGNPGPCEYQVTDLSGKRLAYRHLGVHTNNYAELAGIGAMIQYALANGETVLWTDSQIAMSWIRSLRLGPTVKEPEAIMEMLQSIRKQLDANPQLKLKKWDTRNWGQIPSDFGRK